MNFACDEWKILPTVAFSMSIFDSTLRIKQNDIISPLGILWQKTWQRTILCGTYIDNLPFIYRYWSKSEFAFLVTNTHKMRNSLLSHPVCTILIANHAFDLHHSLSTKLRLLHGANELQIFVSNFVLVIFSFSGEKSRIFFLLYGLELLRCIFTVRSTL